MPSNGLFLCPDRLCTLFKRLGQTGDLRGLFGRDALRLGFVHGLAQGGNIALDLLLVLMADRLIPAERLLGFVDQLLASFRMPDASLRALSCAS